MEKNELIITVSGKCNTGKSRLSYLLKKFLREQGFEVKFKGNLDHPTESHFDRCMCKNFDEAMEKIKETSKIILVEKQLALNFKE